MISLTVDSNFIDDLEDDFVINEDQTLYEFIDGDPVRAFYLGYNINKWFGEINIRQRYLYSKQARHNKDDLEKYKNQIEFWTKKFPEEGKVETAKLAEFVINNMFWEEETEDIDKVKLAFFFGNTIAMQQKKEENEESS